MTLSSKLDNSGSGAGGTSFEVENINEVDVDSFLDEECPESIKDRKRAVSSLTSSTTLTNGKTLVDTMSPSDVQKLRVLLGLSNYARTSPDECALDSSAKKEEAEAEEWHTPFGESTYTILFLYGVETVAFWYAAFIYAIQIITTLLTLIDIVDWTGNGLNLPPNVDVIVTIAQGVALFQALAFQSDLIEAVQKLKDGFYPEVLETYPGATYNTWLASCVAQLIAGMLLLITIYILTMQVDNVLGIMLNFAALHFIADIDDLGFYLAKSGFMGGALQQAANNASSFQVQRKATRQQGCLGRAWKPGAFLFILSILLAGWIAIVFYRVNGHFVCSTIMVNMGDSFVPSLGAFNGIYDFEFAGSGLERRAEYIDRRSQEIDSPSRGIFGYCDDIQAWTFRIESKAESGQGNPCNWIARSSVTTTYDITESVSGPWFARDDTYREVVLEPMGLFCFDCSSSEDEEKSADCGGKGVCSNAVCQCDEGWYGLRCEFKRPCPWLTIDARTEKFASTRDWASDYQSIERSSSGLVEAYHRPVYIHEYSNGDYDVVLFTGGRWALTSSKFLQNGGRIASSDLSDGQEDVGNDIGNFFKHAYHGYRGYSAGSSVAFLSDFMVIGSDGDSSSPVGFSWYRAEEAKSEQGNRGVGQMISTEFLCRACNDEANPCFYDGVCNATNQVCECSRDAIGSLCEIPPVENGHCDPFFNTPEFRMDGGDCCESTCKSTSRYICGTEENGYVSTGYYYCKQPQDQWQIDNLTPDSNVRSPFYGAIVDITDTSMAVVSTSVGTDTFYVFDKVDGSWVMRVSIDSAFSTSELTLSSGPHRVAVNPSFKPPLTLAANSYEGPLSIYKCSVDACNLTQEISDVAFHDLSSDGNILLTAYPKPNTSGFFSDTQLHRGVPRLKVFESIGGQFQSRAEVNITRKSANATLWAMSQSGDGSRMALLYSLPAGIADNGIAEEHVDVRVWNSESNSYDEQAIFPFESALDLGRPRSEPPWYGQLVVLRISQDGTVLAFGAKNCSHVRLHILALDSEGNWHPRESPPINITDCEPDNFWNSHGALELSRDGSTLAFQVDRQIHVFRWDSEFEVWHNVETIHMQGLFLYDSLTAMSSDGNNVAVGEPFERRVSLYSLPGRMQCRTGMSLLRLSLNVEAEQHQYIWQIQDTGTGQIILEGGTYQDEGYWHATFVEEACVPTDACYVFLASFPTLQWISDFPHHHAHYTIYMNGNQVVFGSSFTWVQRAYFGNCDGCASGTLPATIVSIACGPTQWELFEVNANHSETSIEQISNAGLGSPGTGTATRHCPYRLFNQGCELPVVALHDQCLLPSSCYVMRGRGLSYTNATGYLYLEVPEGFEGRSSSTSVRPFVSPFWIDPDPSCPRSAVYFTHGNISECPQPNNTDSFG